MKKLLILVFAGVLISTTYGMAQSRNDLKGPKAKNYKHWKNNDSQTTVLFTSETTHKGPAAKNHKPWRNTPTKIEAGQLVDLSTNRSRVTGPKAKNSKPWELDDESVEELVAEDNHKKQR